MKWGKQLRFIIKVDLLNVSEVIQYLIAALVLLDNLERGLAFYALLLAVGAVLEQEFNDFEVESDFLFIKDHSYCAQL